MWNPPKAKDPTEKTRGWRYAGAVDVPLSEEGIKEASEAGHRLKKIPIDVVYSSMLIRAQMTALIALASHDHQQTPLIVRDNPDPNAQRGLRAHTQRLYNPPSTLEESELANEVEEEVNRVIPVYCSNNLNERDFGVLQGMHNREQKRKYRADDLENWRCSWEAPFPQGESSKQVNDRVIAFFERHIRGKLDAGQNVMVVTHGFVQRVLIKHLLGMSDESWHTEMKLESHPDPKLRATSKLLAQNAVPVIFSYSPGALLPSGGSDDTSSSSNGSPSSSSSSSEGNTSTFSASSPLVSSRREPGVFVRVDTIVSRFNELFRVQDEGMYDQEGETGGGKAAEKKKLKGAASFAPTTKSKKSKL